MPGCSPRPALKTACANHRQVYKYNCSQVLLIILTLLLFLCVLGGGGGVAADFSGLLENTMGRMKGLGRYDLGVRDDALAWRGNI